MRERRRRITTWTEPGFADKLDFNFGKFVEVLLMFPSIRLAGCADSLQFCGKLRDIVFSPPWDTCGQAVKDPC